MKGYLKIMKKMERIIHTDGKMDHKYEMQFMLAIILFQVLSMM